jgi:hypothetical protein
MSACNKCDSIFIDDQLKYSFSCNQHAMYNLSTAGIYSNQGRFIAGILMFRSTIKRRFGGLLDPRRGDSDDLQRTLNFGGK